MGDAPGQIHVVNAPPVFTSTPPLIVRAGKPYTYTPGVTDLDARWHEHPEAVWRLTAMWNDWERGWSRPDGGPTMWARNSLHPHLDQLTVGHGPFSACSPQRHEPARTLPATDWA